MSEKIIIKKGWGEVTLREYLEIGEIQANEELSELRFQQRLRMIAVISSYTYEDLLKINSSNLGPIIETASFLDRTPPKRDQKRIFKINGVDYIFRHDFRNMSAGEMVSVEQLIMDAKNKGINSTPGVMAILFRPTKEDGTITDFEAKSWEERKEFLMDNLTADKFHHELAFFLQNANFKGIDSLLSIQSPHKKQTKTRKVKIKK